jgi:predicted amidohydrolase YtcJ
MRTFLRNTCYAGLLALVATTQPVVAAPQAGEADVVYKNGFVYTVDPVRTRAQAFALRDGKFLAVGSSADFIVLDQNILEVPVEKLHKTKVLKTVLRGHTVYEAK